MAWTFEDKFNSDTKSTGDLNGQDGWSGGTNFDVVTTSPYEGDQHVAAVNANQSITQSITAVTDGIVYVAIQCVTMGSGGDAAVDFFVGGALRIRLQFRDDSGADNVVISNGGTPTTIISGFTEALWYVFEVTINNDDTHDVRYHNGTSWSTPVTGLDANTGGTGDIDSFRFNNGGAQTIYYDYISPTNPISAATNRPRIMMF